MQDICTAAMQVPIQTRNAWHRDPFHTHPHHATVDSTACAPPRCPGTVRTADCEKLRRSH